MPVGPEFALLRNPLENIRFEARLISGDVIQDAGLHDHETTVDPAFADLGLLDEANDAVTIETQAAKSRRWPHGSNGHEIAGRTVKLDQPLEVYVRNAVSVGQQKRPVPEPRPEPPNPAP